jgi:hypothetical protein
MSHEFAIPMYLDTTALLDILASIEDGFSMSNNVTTVSSSSKNTELSGKAAFDITLLPLRLFGMGRRESGSGLSEERTLERKYTYGSLLYKLRKSLRERNLLTRIEDSDAWQRSKGQNTNPMSSFKDYSQCSFCNFYSKFINGKDGLLRQTCVLQA